MQSRRELHTRYRQRSRRLLQRRKRPVQIQTQVPRRLRLLLLIEPNCLRHLHHQLLRIPVSEIKTRTLEHEALKANNKLRMIFKSLNQSKVSFQSSLTTYICIYINIYIVPDRPGSNAH